MSTPNKPNIQNKPTGPAAAPTSHITGKSSAKKSSESMMLPYDNTFLFDKENYIWMTAGVALIFIGFMLMSGGKSPDPHGFLYDEIYSFRRITLAPIIILAGFGIEVHAIMKLPKGATKDRDQPNVQ